MPDTPKRLREGAHTMSEDVVLYAKTDRIATITLNRPDKFNTLRTEVLDTLRLHLEQANRDPEVRIIMLEGNGDAFCAGFDFSGGLEHFDRVREQGYDPGMDMHWVTNSYTSYISTFMGLWRGLKPTIAKVHGYCVGAARSSRCAPTSSSRRTAPASARPTPGCGAATSPACGSTASGSPRRSTTRCRANGSAARMPWPPG